MKHKNKLMMLIIMVLAIGFAAVTTTLVINGTGILATNEEDFDVYFSDAMLDGSDISNQISSDGRTITYTSSVLEVAGDKSILEYRVVNNSTQYDAEIKITCELEGNNYVTIENSLQNQVIEAKGEREGILTAEMIKTSTEERDIPLECTITAEAIERTTPGEESGEDGKLTTFSLYGHLVDEEGKEVVDETVVVYSNPVYGKTDEHGYLYVEGIEKGSHTLYLMGKKTEEEIKGKSETEVASLAREEVGITTSTTVVEFENGYRFDTFKIKRTTLVNVEIDPNNGEEIEHKELKQGMKYGDLGTPEKEGSKFIGWYTEEGEEITDRSTITKDEDHKVIARYEAGVYEITYDANGGTIPSTSGWTGSGATATKTVTYNGTYGTLPTPTHTNATFDGWYTSGGTKISSTTKVTSTANHTLTAKWIFSSLYDTILKDNTVAASRSTYTTIFANSTTGTVYSSTKTDDGSTTYYYAGNTTNNWVKFGTYSKDYYFGYSDEEKDAYVAYDTLAACQSAASYNVGCEKAISAGEAMYWRILRTDSGKIVRLLYSGNSPYEKHGNITSIEFNKTVTPNAYVGYKYTVGTSLATDRGNANSSTIKTYLENWYAKELLTNYDSYISKNTTYCVDRATNSYVYNGTTYFAGRDRLFSNKTPTFQCNGAVSTSLTSRTQYSTASVNDLLSVNSTVTNNKLVYPIGLATADEIAFSGALYEGILPTTQYPWYFTNANNESIVDGRGWWTMTPSYFNYSNAANLVIFGESSSARGSIGVNNVASLRGVRPVIGINACVNVSKGSGTAASPYELTLGDDC